MKAHYKTTNGRLTFEMQAENPKDLFRQISEVQEVFDSEPTCGCCGSTDLRFLARKVDDYDFYELACQAQGCRARFAFGQAKKGGALFPKRKDEDGNWLPNRGWSKYEPKGDGRTNGTGPKPEMRNGVPAFGDWKAAEESGHWGGPWISVAGTLYKLDSDGSKYLPQPIPTKGKVA